MLQTGSLCTAGGAHQAQPVENRAGTTRGAAVPLLQICMCPREGKAGSWGGVHFNTIKKGAVPDDPDFKQMVPQYGLCCVETRGVPLKLMLGRGGGSWPGREA